MKKGFAKKLLPALGLLAVASAAVTVPVMAQGQDATADNRLGEPVAYSVDGVPHYAVKMTALHDSSVPTMTDETRDRIDGLLSTSDFRDSSGKTLLTDGPYAIGVVTDTKDKLCMSFSVEGEVASAGCTPGLPADGLQLAIRSSSERPLLVYGLATDGVTSVTVETTDGKRVNVPIENEAYLWHAPDANTRLAAIESVRFGKTTRRADEGITSAGNFG